ncbi:MAG: hypothetical protein ACYDCQ_09865 [Dehalococcoidia bacterium]
MNQNNQSDNADPRPVTPPSPVKAEPGAAPAWSAEDVRERDFQQVQPGWTVYSSDGEQLGDIARLGPTWMAVPYGTTDEHTMYLPMNYIESIANKRVVLNQPAALLIDMKLHEPPGDFAQAREAVGGVQHDPRRAEAGSSAIAEPNDLPAQIPPATATPPGPQSWGSLDSGLSPAGRTPIENEDARLTAGSPTSPVAGGGQAASEYVAVTRGAAPDAALQPAEPEIDQSGVKGHTSGGYATKPAIGGDRVARAETRSSRAGANVAVSTRMDAPADGEDTDTPHAVNAPRTMGRALEDRSGFAPLNSRTRSDIPGAPTQQAGVRDQQEYTPNRTQFSYSGVPGDNKERNVTDLDLTKNRHPEGNAFDSQASTVGRRLAPGEPSVAQRSLPPSASISQPKQ